MQKLKSFTLSAVLTLAICGLASGDSMAAPAGSEKEHHGQGYVFFAPGATFAGGQHIGTMHFGGGGEVLPYKGIGIGGEIGYFTPWEDFSAGFGILSANGSYHFLRNRKVSPFVTAGYSLGFRDGSINLVNFGGGINWWFANRLGLRLEARDHIRSREPFARVHYFSGRIGLSFR
jgi:hypothetical protein